MFEWQLRRCILRKKLSRIFILLDACVVWILSYQNLSKCLCDSKEDQLNLQWCNIVISLSQGREWKSGRERAIDAFNATEHNFCLYKRWPWSFCASFDWAEQEHDSLPIGTCEKSASRWMDAIDCFCIPLLMSLHKTQTNPMHKKLIEIRQAPAYADYKHEKKWSTQPYSHAKHHTHIVSHTPKA